MVGCYRNYAVGGNGCYDSGNWAWMEGRCFRSCSLLAWVHDCRWPYVSLCVCVCVYADGHVLDLSFGKWGMKTKAPTLSITCVSVAMVTLSLKSHYISHINHIAEV